MMEETRLDPAAAFLYPMPMVPVGAMVEGRGRYWSVGEPIGMAWSAGKVLQKKS